MVVAGMSAAEMALKLHISATTVKTHLRFLYASLGASGRASAVLAACELGLMGQTRLGRIRMILDELAGVRDEAPNRSRYAELYDRVEMILNEVPRT